VHKYIARRLIYAVPALLGVTIIVFLTMRVLPGDVLSAMFGEGAVRLTEQERQHALSTLGLDKPLHMQYLSWLKDIGTGKLGESFWRGDKIADLVQRRGFITGEIAIIAVLFSWLVGLPVGILGAVRQNSVLDYASRISAVLFLAIPSFWLGAVIALALLLGLGYRAPLGIIFPWDDFIGNMKIVVGPAVVLGLAQSAYVARLARSTLLEVIREDYIRTARAKGLREQAVIWRHALQNALLPVITLSGVLFGFLLGGSVAVEVAFGVPGLGTTLVRAFNENDFMIIQNLVLLYGVVFVVINLLVDLTYAWLDPRIRYT
jgi:peptide/nickel transport system permease protein